MSTQTYLPYWRISRRFRSGSVRRCVNKPAKDAFETVGKIILTVKDAQSRFERYMCPTTSDDFDKDVSLSSALDGDETAVFPIVTVSVTWSAAPELSRGIPA